MLSHAFVLDRRLPVLAALLFFRPETHAGGFQCEHQTAGAEPALVCTDTDSGGGDHVAHVSLRKMPRWGRHAGLTLIDFCLLPRAFAQPEFPSVIRFDAPATDPKSKGSGPAAACSRKYCTDVNQSYSVLVNSIPFPVGWTAVSFWLGYSNQSFSIQCNEILDETEIHQ
jgi:hypothetical protein